MWRIIEEFSIINQYVTYYQWAETSIQENPCTVWKAGETKMD